MEAEWRPDEGEPEARPLCVAVAVDARALLLGPSNFKPFEGDRTEKRCEEVEDVVAGGAVDSPDVA